MVGLGFASGSEGLAGDGRVNKGWDMLKVMMLGHCG